MPEVPGFSLYIYIPCTKFLKYVQSTRGFVRCATVLYFLLQEKRVVLLKLLNVLKVIMSDIERYCVVLAA
jgi:hypothetical protein